MNKARKRKKDFKTSKASRDSFDRRLQLLRREIDKADRQILAGLRRRFGIVAKVGRLKRQGRRRIVQNQREVELLRDRSQLGEKMGLRKSFVRGIFGMILAEATFQQRKAPSVKKLARNELKGQ